MYRIEVVLVAMGKLLEKEENRRYSSSISQRQRYNSTTNTWISNYKKSGSYYALHDNEYEFLKVVDPAASPDRSYGVVFLKDYLIEDHR